MEVQQISSNDFVLLICNRGERKIVNIKEQKGFIQWRKQKIDVSLLVGEPYNRVYQVSDDGKLRYDEKNIKEFYNYELQNEDQGELEEGDPNAAEQEGDEIQGKQETIRKQICLNDKDSETLNNQYIYSNSGAQELTAEQIKALKTDFPDKNKLIQEITKHSQTFGLKTAMSQLKYLNKQQKKYFFYISCQKCTPETLISTLFEDDIKSICFMRIDSLSLLLQRASLKKNSKVLLFENMKGLVMGAISLRLGGTGNIVLVNDEGKKNFNQHHHFRQLNVPAKYKELIRIETSLQVLEKQEQFSQIVVAGDFRVSLIAEQFFDNLKIGGVFVGFSSSLELLSETFEFMHKSKQFVFITLCDTFLREYQVLDQRTHPMMTMDGFSGFVISAYKVE